MANFSKGTEQLEGRKRVDKGKKGRLIPRIATDNKDRSVLKSIQIVKKAIHWAPAIQEQ